MAVKGGYKQIVPEGLKEIHVLQPNAIGQTGSLSPTVHSGQGMSPSPVKTEPLSLDKGNYSFRTNCLYYKGIIWLAQI